jgi:6-phosphogluconolactonase
MAVTIIDGADDAGIAGWVAERLSAALRSGGPVAMTVPGGSTPFPILELLADEPLDWRRVTVWPGDDRVVPEDHPASNAGRIRALLEPVGAEVVSLTIMEQVPHFALAWLGMGADGHVASLFPNTDPRADDPLAIRRLTPDPLPPEAPFDRVSLTIPALVASDTLMFVIRGGEKRALFEQAVAGGNDLPVARLLAAATGEVTCFA